MDAARLAEALDAHGVTVSQLARESSVNRSLLSKIVNGHRQPGKWTTWALNSALSRLGISEREVYDDVAD